MFILKWFLLLFLIFITSSFSYGFCFYDYFFFFINEYVFYTISIILSSIIKNI